MKGLSGWAWVVIAIIALYFINPGMFPFSAGGSGPTTKVCADGTVVAISATCPTETPQVTCPSTMQTTIKTAIQNPLSGTLSYEVANLTLVDASDGTVKSTSDFTTRGSTKSYSTGVALTCGKSYKMYTTPGTNASVKYFASCSKDVGKIEGDTAYVDFACANSTQPEFQVYWSNWSQASAAGWAKDGYSAGADAVAQNGQITYTLRYRANSTLAGSSQFGNDELSTYVCADFDLSKFSKSSGVTTDRTDWVEVDLPKYCSNNGFDKAWKIPAIKSTQSERDAKVAIKADLGDPATNVTLVFVDEAYYVGADGKIKSGTVDDSGTDLGQTNRYIGFFLS
jgi:hypothetical protein